MIIIDIVAPTLFGYVLGSIPVGYVIGRFYGKDVRRVGSGRTGGTNVFRAAGPIAAVLTVVGDALKAGAAVGLARLLGTELAATMAGVGVLAGHNWPLFLSFKGGAGGITGGTALIFLSPIAGLIVAALGIATLPIWRYASVASLTVALLSPIVLFISALLGGPMVHVIYGIVAAVMIVYALRPNIRRLRAGTERRIGESQEAHAVHEPR